VVTSLDEGRVLYLNPQARAQFKVRLEALADVPLDRLYRDPADRVRLLETLQRQGSVSNLAIDLVDLEGRPFHGLISATPVDYAGTPALLSAVNDITERREAELALQQERTHLRALLQTIPDLVWVKDATGRYLICNPAVERLLGHPLSTIVGKTDDDFHPPEQAEFFRANDQRAIAADHPLSNEEWLHCAEEGSRRLFEVRKTPLRTEDHTLIGVLGIARDITDHRRIAQALGERIKEQRCLASVFTLTEDMAAPLAEQVQQVVARVASGWPVPERTGVRLEIGDHTTATPDFRLTPWMQTMATLSPGGTTIRLCIAPLDAPSPEDEAVVVEEKQRLGEAIVHRLAEVIERRRAQAALRERDSYIAAMFAQTTDAMLLVDPQTLAIVDCNTTAHQGLGYSREEFCQLQVEDFQADYSVQQLFAAARQVVAGTPVHLVTQHRHKDGSLRDVDVTLQPVTIGEHPLISSVWHDITEHKNRERALQESERRLQAITDSALDGIVMMDPGGVISYWNPAAAAIFGYSAAETLGCNLHQLLMPQQYVEQYQRGFLQFQQNGSGPVVGRTMEMSARRKDGRKITVALSVSAVELQGAWHAVGILRDISEFKHQQNTLQTALREAESANQSKEEILTHLEELVAGRTAELDAVNERLRQSEERYTLALEATNDGLWDWNLSTGEVYCNPTYFRMLGYEPGELEPLIENWSKLVHPDDRERTVAEVYRRLAEESGFELEFRMRAKSGRFLWILSRGKVVTRDRDGRPVRVVGIHTDLTARKQIEQELRAADDEQRAIFDAAASGIGFIRDRIVVRCNRKLEEIFGYGPGEMAGTTTRSWYETEAEFVKTGQEVQRDLQATGRFQAERQLVRRDGRLFWARMNGQAMDPNDISKGLVGMLDDITEERQAAEALRQAKEAAEAATRAKSEFLANMSHEIRTPMNAILGFAHLLRRDPLTPLQTSQLDKLSESARHLLKIINDILDISKIEASRLELEDQAFEPGRVIHQVCELVADEVAAKQLRLQVELDHLPDRVRGDGPRLRQILLNLVGNAVKFTAHGTVTIRARVIHQEGEQVMLRFEIQDSGIGMTREQLDRVFLAFEQADSSMTRRFGGTGLGLAISKRLVERMGGRMGADSQPGQGSVFWLELPFAAVSPQESANGHSDAFGHVRALVVSANERSTAVLSALLAHLGIRTEAANSGTDGLAQVLQADRSDTPFTLLVLAWPLSGMTAAETLHSLRFLPLRVRPATLAVVPAGDLATQEEAMRQGVASVLAEPVTPSALMDALMATVPPPAHETTPVSTVAQELAHRRGSRILLVEDNLVNQEVARMLLESLGMEVRVADNGQAALELFTAEPVDLVFMDMQMPVLDGLEATAAIRRLDAGHSVPILAMTANAFGEDREQCLRAGMNDHIAKPIDLDTLHDLLVRWLPPRLADGAAPGQPSPAGNDDASPESPIPAALATMDGLDVAAGLRLLNNDRHLYLRLLQQFVDQHGRDGALLAQQAAASALDSLRHTAHALKGAAATLGARRIHHQAVDLEQMAVSSAERPRLDVQINRLDASLAALAEGVRQAVAQSDHVPQPASLEGLPVGPLLERFAALLAEEDSLVNELLAQSMPLLLATFGDQARVLCRQIESFDYADALHTVRSLQGKSGATAAGHRSAPCEGSGPAGSGDQG
jgi:PAS domain S-box-containing protein